MSISNLTGPGRGGSPLSLLAAVLVGGGTLFMLLDRDKPARPNTDDCGAGSVGCEADDPAFSPLPTATQILQAQDACIGVGYLCADLQNEDRFRVERWKGFSGTLIVHVPLPEFEDRALGVRLQNAAAAGIRAWNGQPFPIQIDERGDRDSHFAVQWTTSLGGTRIGVARTQWSSQSGRQVVSIELTTRSPYDPARVIDPRQIRLTAAHEMGHALGLPHSDSKRDVMYPANTASSLSARDYRTMEVLYGLPDGTVILR